MLPEETAALSARANIAPSHIDKPALPPHAVPESTPPEKAGDVASVGKHRDPIGYVHARNAARKKKADDANKDVQAAETKLQGLGLQGNIAEMSDKQRETAVSTIEAHVSHVLAENMKLENEIHALTHVRDAAPTREEREKLRLEINARKNQLNRGLMAVRQSTSAINVIKRDQSRMERVVTGATFQGVIGVAGLFASIAFLPQLIQSIRGSSSNSDNNQGGAPAA